MKSQPWEFPWRRAAALTKPGDPRLCSCA